MFLRFRASTGNRVWFLYFAPYPVETEIESVSIATEGSSNENPSPVFLCLSAELLDRRVVVLEGDYKLR